MVGGIAAFTMMKPSNTVPGPGESGTPSVTGETSGMKSLKELFALGTSQKCTFTNTTDASESSGVVYLSNGKMRGDFTSVAAGKTIQSHMIVEGKTSYVWSDAMAGQGIKMSFEDTDTPSSAPEGQSVDLDAKTNYSCSGWGVDQAIFVLPQGVEFKDLSAMMQGLTPPKAGAGVEGGTGVDVKAMQCSYCAQAGDADSVAQCKAALGCN